MSKNHNLTNDMKKRIVDSYNAGNNSTKIAEILILPRSTVTSVISKYLKTGIVERKEREYVNTKKLTAEILDSIKIWIDNNCTLSLKAISNLVQSNYNVNVSTTTVRKAIIGFNYSLKRTHLIPERRNAPLNVDERYVYAQKFLALGNDYLDHQIVFIDEVGFNVSMRVSKGRSLVGNRAIQNVMALRTRNISVCCAITKTNVVYYQASLTAFNTEKFSFFLSNLILKLKEQSNDKFVFIMDNVKFHKTNEIKILIENSEFEYLYLPPYSPFLNPIENMFSKWKNHVKRGNPENELALMALINNGMQLINETDLNGYYRNMMRYILRCISRDIILD